MPLRLKLGNYQNHRYVHEHFHQDTRCLLYSAGGMRELMVIVSIILSDNVCFLTQNEADKLREEVSQTKKKVFLCLSFISLSLRFIATDVLNLDCFLSLSLSRLLPR